MATKMLWAVVVAALAAAVQFPPAPSAPMTSLVETERAFARMSAAQGRRAAFLAFFAADAVMFTPAPVNAPRVIREWPAAEPFTLDWEPRFGDVSEAGDLGYTTGPFVRTSRGRATQVTGSGWYVTVWKRQPDGSWKVAVDAGVTSPDRPPLSPAAFEMPPGDGSVLRPATASLRNSDTAICASASRGGWPGALRAAGDETTRVYRDGMTPFTFGTTGRSSLQEETALMVCEPTEYLVSGSADLGYTLGTYTIKRSPPETGHYLRIWKRRAGEWKLAIDLSIPGAQ